MSVAMPTARPLELTCLRPETSATPAATALVPVVATQWVPPAEHVPSPDPTFVTQLIADAERLADRRRWPRDRAADALSAYDAHQPVFGAGLKTRQMI
jgi:hypothetical protein